MPSYPVLGAVGAVSVVTLALFARTLAVVNSADAEKRALTATEASSIRWVQGPLVALSTLTLVAAIACVALKVNAK